MVDATVDSRDRVTDLCVICRFFGGSPLMSGLSRVAHAPPWPAAHVPPACSAWVRGLPPPAAVRCSAALRAHSRGDPPREEAYSAAKTIETPTAWCRMNLVGAQLRHQ